MPTPNITISDFPPILPQILMVQTRILPSSRPIPLKGTVQTIVAKKKEELVKKEESGSTTDLSTDPENCSEKA